MAAVLVIDVQREFFSPEGIMGQRYIKTQPLLSNIDILIQNSRSNNYPVYWIRSEYNCNVKSEYPSHTGKPCCVAESELSKFIPEIESLIEPQDKIITKHYYSAFMGTGLDQLIPHRRLLVVGVTANNCVKHTAKSAYDLGYDVTLIKNCIAGGTMSRVSDILKEMDFAHVISDIAEFSAINL